MTNEELITEIRDGHERQDRPEGEPPMCLACSPLDWPCDAVRAADALEAVTRAREDLDEAFDRDLPWRYDELSEQSKRAEAAIEELEAQLANAKAGWDSALRIVNEGNEIIKQVGAERDAAVAAIERVRAIHEQHPRWPDKCGGCDGYYPCATVAALDGAPEPECLSIPIPNVPFGPEGVAPTIATASYLIEVVKKIDFGYANVGGSNVTATLRKLLVDTAEALRGLPVEGEKP